MTEFVGPMGLANQEIGDAADSFAAARLGSRRLYDGECSEKFPWPVSSIPTFQHRESVYDGQIMASLSVATNVATPMEKTAPYGSLVNTWKAKIAS